MKKRILSQILLAVAILTATAAAPNVVSRDLRNGAPPPMCPPGTICE